MCIVGGKERGGGSCVRQPKSKAKGTECHLSQEQIGQYISNKRESEKMQVVKDCGVLCVVGALHSVMVVSAKCSKHTQYNNKRKQLLQSGNPHKTLETLYINKPEMKKKIQK